MFRTINIHLQEVTLYKCSTWYSTVTLYERSWWPVIMYSTMQWCGSMLPHHYIVYNDVFLPNILNNYNFS